MIRFVFEAITLVVAVLLFVSGLLVMFDLTDPPSYQRIAALTLIALGLALSHAVSSDN